VSPFFILKDVPQFDAVNKTFYQEHFDFDSLRKLVKKSYVLYGTEDPYVPEEQPKLFAEKMNSKLIVIPHGGHLNTEAGFTTFPELLAVCKTCMN